jgi:hypothetical protein
MRVVYVLVEKDMAMLEEQFYPTGEKPRFTVIRGDGRRASKVVLNLMHDTSAPTLIWLAERYGLRRIPGLSKRDLIMRILRRLSASDLTRLQQDLIAARFGPLTVDSLLQMALHQDSQRLGRPGKPRLDQVSAGDAILVEGGTGHWVYTMRGHDAEIDLVERRLSCDCTFFGFASRRKVLCKHLATAFKLLPEAYAREALIDLLVSREYGDGQATRWQFESRRAA